MINKEDILTILKNIKDENNSKKVDSYIFRINEMSDMEWNWFVEFSKSNSTDDFVNFFNNNREIHELQWRTNLNDIVSFGKYKNTLHIHLVPRDLHTMLNKKGFNLGTLALIDALEKIKKLIISDEKFSDVEEIIAFSKLIRKPISVIFEKVGFDTRTMTTAEAKEDYELKKYYNKFVEEEKKVGIAKISKERLFSEEWEKVISQIKFKLIGINDIDLSEFIHQQYLGEEGLAMEEKNKSIENYIMEQFEILNNEYPGIINEEKLQEIINYYTNSSDDFIITKINDRIANGIKEYQKQKKQEEMYYYPDAVENVRESRTFEQIKKGSDILQKIIKKSGLHIYYAGGMLPYILLNEESGRMHDDIDTVCRMQDMEALRELFKNEGLYMPEWDSRTYAKDGKDYGFEIKIDGVPIGIYPFEYKEKKLFQYTYDPYNHYCKIKSMKLEHIEDYITQYNGNDGQTYDTVTLEFLKKLKDTNPRPKDVVDSKKIESIGIRQKIYDRLELPIEIQSVLGEELNHRDKQTKSKKSGLEDCIEDPNMMLSIEQNATMIVKNEVLDKGENIKEENIKGE